MDRLQSTDTTPFTTPFFQIRDGGGWVGCGWGWVGVILSTSYHQIQRLDHRTCARAHTHAHNDTAQHATQQHTLMNTLTHTPHTHPSTIHTHTRTHTYTLTRYSQTLQQRCTNAAAFLLLANMLSTASGQGMCLCMFPSSCLPPPPRLLNHPPAHGSTHGDAGGTACRLRSAVLLRVWRGQQQQQVARIL